MKQNFYNLIAFYNSKEKFWLDCFSGTGNENFLRRAKKYKSKIDVLQAFGRGNALGYSLKQTNEVIIRECGLADRQLNLF